MKQKERAKEIGYSSSTLQRLINDIKIQSPCNLTDRKELQRH